MTETPTVSVIIPVLNGEATLAQAVTSVVETTEAEIEILIVDNGSTDGSMQLAETLKSEDDRIRVFEEPNSGVSHARNRGIEEARGRFVAFLDADDVLSVGSLDGRIELLDTHPELGLAYSPAIFVDEALTPLGWEQQTKNRITFEDMYSNPCNPSAIMGRSEVIKSQRFPIQPNGEDWLYLARLLRSGRILGRAERGSVLWRQTACSASQKSILDHERHCLEVLDLLYRRDDEVSDQVPEWSEGLNYPPLSEMKCRRITRALVYTLLANDLEGANLAVGMLQKLGTFPSHSSLINTLEWAAVRTRSVPLSEVRLQIDRLVDEIRTTGQPISIETRVPALAQKEPHDHLGPDTGGPSAFRTTCRRVLQGLRFYLSPSGAVLGTSLSALTLAEFTPPSVSHVARVLGFAGLAIFLPYRFERDKARTDRRVLRLEALTKKSLRRTPGPITGRPRFLETIITNRALVKHALAEIDQLKDTLAATDD